MFLSLQRIALDYLLLLINLFLHVSSSSSPCNVTTHTCQRVDGRYAVILAEKGINMSYDFDAPVTNGDYIWSMISINNTVNGDITMTQSGKYFSTDTKFTIHNTDETVQGHYSCVQRGGGGTNCDQDLCIRLINLPYIYNFSVSYINEDGGQALAELDVRYNRTFDSCLPVQRVTLYRSSQPNDRISCFSENLSQCPNRVFFVSNNYSASNDGSPGFNFSMTLNVSSTMNETFEFSIVVTTSVNSIGDTPTVFELSNTVSISTVILTVPSTNFVLETSSTSDPVSTSMLVEISSTSSSSFTMPSVSASSGLSPSASTSPTSSSELIVLIIPISLAAVVLIIIFILVVLVALFKLRCYDRLMGKNGNYRMRPDGDNNTINTNGVENLHFELPVQGNSKEEQI